uniref:FBD domain-containing protein n=1 Tax=Aegilops tauschii TaxID=37682 RepID=M8BEH6_AEGTA
MAIHNFFRHDVMSLLVRMKNWQASQYHTSRNPTAQNEQLRLELVCLPKLEKLTWYHWLYECSPLSLCYVPSLGELELSSALTLKHVVFKLNEVLHGTTSIHTLTLDFQGENLWMQPEMKQLCTAFNKLRKLSVYGIFVEFDITWTTAFLVAAPSIEILCIEIWDHDTCGWEDNNNRKLVFVGISHGLVRAERGRGRMRDGSVGATSLPATKQAGVLVFGARRVSSGELEEKGRLNAGALVARKSAVSISSLAKSLEWEMDSHSSKNWLLKELQIFGFRPLEQLFTFIKALLERAPNLRTIVLKGDMECVWDCVALTRDSFFPKSEDEQEMVVRRITDGKLSPRVIFHE